MVAALDQALSVAPAPSELRRVRLNELGSGLEPSWDRRPQRRRPLRSLAVLDFASLRDLADLPPLQDSDSEDAVQGWAAVS